MRIAYFVNIYPRATDTFIRREVLGLRSRGLDVLTYSVRKSGSDHDVDDEVASEKKNTHYLFPVNFIGLILTLVKTLVSKPGPFIGSVFLAFKTSRPGLKGHFLQLAYFLEAVLLARQLVEDRVEHLHNHFGDNGGTVTLLASMLAGVPYSISIHGPHIFFDGLHWALAVKTERAKFISCIGHYCMSQMMFYSDKDCWDKFRIVRCGIDLEQFEYRAPERKARKIVYTGRLSAEKGLPVLFDSIAQLKQRDYLVEVSLLGDGEDRKFLEQLAREQGIDETIEFAGFVDQVTLARTLRSSDIFVLPSFAEGIPVALMEAMAIGIPVIATYVGGVAELVVDQQTGQMVFPSDSTALANAIARYIDDEKFCRTISENARLKVEKEFNIEDQVDKLANLFTQNNISRTG